MSFDRNKLLFFIVLFLCTGVLLLDVATLMQVEKKDKVYSTNVAGIIKLDNIRYSGARFVNIIEKNMFTSSEKPVMSDVTSAITPPNNSGFNFTVNGIIVSPGNRIVLVTDTRSNQVHFLVEGDRLDEWQVSDISNRNVIFEKSDGSRQVLQINKNDNK